MKRAYITKNEAINLIKEMHSDIKITGFTVTGKKPVSWEQRRFGKHGPIHKSTQFIHIKELSDEQHEKGIKGERFE